MTDRKSADPFGTLKQFETPAGPKWLYHLPTLGKAVGADLEHMPFSVKILLEAVLRNCDDYLVHQDDVRRLAGWRADHRPQGEVPFIPARVLLQDFTGVPCVVDLAAMRAAVSRLGGSPLDINPLVPVDLVIDHSVQVDHYGSPDAIRLNTEREFQRNQERYTFLRWGQNAFQGLQVVPPETGIVHQVNLEYLANVVVARRHGDREVALPDTLVGTDSHTTMINGLGVLAWGVGGIEAEAAMLGQPLYMLAPRVVGFRLSGKLREGVTATDLTLTITQMLRQKGVVDHFVEYFGPGLSAISLPDRATMANMAPEYGATMGFFPVDEETLRYLRVSGRGEAADLTELYCKEQGLFRVDGGPEPRFTDVLELDLGDVEPSLAGPKRPQDRVTLSGVQGMFRKVLTAPVTERGYGLSESDLGRTATFEDNGAREEMGHGSVIIAAITSCTNTSNPSVMIGAGLLAKKAMARGLKVKPYVKTSLAPGSKVVTEYLREAGLLEPLEGLGFNVVGYGCTTCIGNSGPLDAPVTAAVNEGSLVAASVLSGNRNFEGRIHPLSRANFLASPPLVVAYALAGTTDIDLEKDPLGTGADGKPVYLRDVWPSQEEVAATVSSAMQPEMFSRSYGDVFAGGKEWRGLPAPEGELYQWDAASTYIQEPPFFIDMGLGVEEPEDIIEARVLVKVADSVTTDHISPAGNIALDSPAGRYLTSQGVKEKDFNSYGSRRGNHEVMMRGTFANIRLKNLLVPGSEGNVTVHLPSGEEMAIYDAAQRYRAEGTPLIVIAGKEYGTGSSRDWAAKGTLLLGVQAVLAESFERIHCSNLVGMGVLPLEFEPGSSADKLGLSGEENFDILGVSSGLTPRKELHVRAHRPGGAHIEFPVIARLDTPVHVDYYKNGGILQTVLRKLLKR